MERTGSIGRIGVMGGTFDPIHLGHLAAASEVLHVLALDLIIFTPAGDPWQRAAPAPAEDRLLMTELAVADFTSFAVSRIELDRKGPTYTADTMETLRDFYGKDTSFYFIAGADAVLNLGTWKKLDRLSELTEIVAVTRPGSDLSNFRAAEGWPAVNLVEMPGIDVSGSQIRARVREGRPIDFLVPPDVATYIRDHGLYVDAPRRRTA